ncbi:MAG: NUDIX domain-containing protein [Candidatus Sulfotelmatobacter sp.]
MGRGAKNSRDSGFTVGSETHQPSSRLVRLSQLRKFCECEQVAAVCYRWRGDSIEFLLVRTRSGGRWTFPKGSAEPGLTHAQAAALEAFEEAGVHGRIEEASFAIYVRRDRSRGRRSDARSGERQFAVSAHLCEVSRLSPPKESRRKRTWFSAVEARRRLREGRRSEDGAEFTRVIDKAVARIRRLRAGTGMVDDPPQDRAQQSGLHLDIPQKDGLQKVRFEAFVEARDGEASSMQNLRRQLNAMRQVAVPVIEDHSREILRGDVLQFEPPREKKAKALGSGGKGD